VQGLGPREVHPQQIGQDVLVDLGSGVCHGVAFGGAPAGAVVGGPEEYPVRDLRCGVASRFTARPCAPCRPRRAPAGRM